MDKLSDPAFALGFIDLTALNDSDTDASIRQLARAAQTPLGTVAALCVYPRFVATAKTALAELGVEARVATVANFSHGEKAAAAAAREVADAAPLTHDARVVDATISTAFAISRGSLTA